MCNSCSHDHLGAMVDRFHMLHCLWSEPGSTPGSSEFQCLIRIEAVPRFLRPAQQEHYSCMRCHLKDTRSNSKHGSNWFDSNLAHWACYRVLIFWRSGRNGIIALSLNLSGGDEPSIGSYQVLSANFVPSLMVAANRFGYNIAWKCSKYKSHGNDKKVKKEMTKDKQKHYLIY